MPHKRKLAISGPKTAPRLRPAAIDKARTDVMLMIEHQRARGETNAFLDKARVLLTQHWAKATWASRATLLKTADWLIRLAAVKEEPASVPLPRKAL